MEHSQQEGNMKLLSKKKLILFLSIFTIISGCLNFEEPSKGFTISDEEKNTD
jgi:hypothetical protein